MVQAHGGWAFAETAHRYVAENMNAKRQRAAIIAGNSGTFCFFPETFLFSFLFQLLLYQIYVNLKKKQ